MAEKLRLEYAGARHILRNEISRRKSECWKELCADLDADLWRRAYQITVKRFQKCQVEKAEEVLNIVDHLFPSAGGEEFFLVY